MQWKIHIVDPTAKKRSHRKRYPVCRTSIQYLLNRRNLNEKYLSEKDMEILYISFVSSISSDRYRVKSL